MCVSNVFLRLTFFLLWSCWRQNANGHEEIQPTSDGLQPNSDGLQPACNGLQPTSLFSSVRRIFLFWATAFVFESPGQEPSSLECIFVKACMVLSELWKLGWGTFELADARHECGIWLLGAPGLTTRSKTLLGAPGLTSSNKKLLETRNTLQKTIHQEISTECESSEQRRPFHVLKFWEQPANRCNPGCYCRYVFNLQ